MTASLALLLALVQEGHEEKDLAAARRAVTAWNDEAWDLALAPEPTLTVKLSGPVRDAEGRSGMASVSVTYRGRDDVKAALAELYKEQDPRVEIETEIIRGHEAALIGEVSVLTPEGTRRELPLVVHVRFDETCKIRHMSVTAVAARPAPAPAR